MAPKAGHLQSLRLTTDILVEKAHPSPLASNPNPFVLPAQSFTDLDIPQELQYSPERPKTSQGLRTSYLVDDFDEMPGRGGNPSFRRSRGELAELIEFFRNHEPPAGNLMSRPFENDMDSGRWDALKMTKKRRSKSMGRIPQQIRLPDSAVSGRTIGGHRHIAISIPLEATPFGERPRSQYPVYTDDDAPPVPPVPPIPPVPQSAVRTYVNDRGVVTVLKAVAEDPEVRPTRTSVASQSHVLDNSMAASSSQSRPPTGSSQRPASRSLSRQSRSSHKQARQEHSEPLPPLASRPLLGRNHSGGSWESAGTARGSGGSDLVPVKEFQRSAYPARGSSMAASRKPHQPSASIDSVIATHSNERNPSPMPQEGKPQRRAAMKQTSSRDAPPISLETSATGLRSRSQSRDDYQSDTKEPLQRNSKVTLINERPVVTSREDSPTPSLMSGFTRRDKVRDKKRRDMEAARRLKEQKQLESDSGVEQEATNISVATSQPTLCPIMVVVDVQPDAELPMHAKSDKEMVDEDSEIEEVDARRSLPLDERTSSPEIPILSLDKAGPLLCLGNPTPPVSTKNSPEQKIGFDDRTSLTRRREWSAYREQERKRRQAAALTKPRVKQLSAPGERQEESKAINPEQEVLKLYEAYRDHRMVEMDRRLRRLEKNGDVWLRAIVPLMDNMNKNMESMNDRLEDEERRDWASDNEVAAADDGFDRAIQKRRLTRTASMSQGRMLEELAHRRQKSVSWEDDGDDDSTNEDESGLDSIEPLMRELAGQSRLRQGRVQTDDLRRGRFVRAN